MACILAAGMGTRLGPRGELIPKGFLKLGPQPIIEESIRKLVHCGVEKIVLVTGHLSSYYVELASHWAEHVVLVHNTRYQETGSLASLQCAAPKLNQSFLLLESDLIYETRALEICQSNSAEDLVLVSGFTGAGDEVYVDAKDGILVTMSKKRDALSHPPLGEFVGICKISVPLCQRLVARLQEEGSSPRLDYETDGLVGCAENYAIPCRLEENLIWAEIDDEGHLQRAVETIYPKLKNR